MDITTLHNCAPFGHLKSGVASLALSLMIVVPALPATAELATTTDNANNVVDGGSSERINYSGKLRMLSQRVVAASCFYQNDIASEESLAVLQAAIAEFELITDALEFGNDDMGILGAEELRRTLFGITKLRELWTPVVALADTVAAGEGTNQDISMMAEHSEPLLDMAKQLVVQISGQYASQTTVLQRDALAIDVAGRQRMLSQRVSKNVCLLANGINTDVSADELAKSAQVFDTSLVALRSGMPEAGIQPPPNAEIEAGLDMVIDDWSAIAPITNSVSDGKVLDDEQLIIVFQLANKMTAGMNGVVSLYSDASKMNF